MALCSKNIKIYIFPSFWGNERRQKPNIPHPKLTSIIIHQVSASPDPKSELLSIENRKSTFWSLIVKNSVGSMLFLWCLKKFATCVVHKISNLQTQKNVISSQSFYSRVRNKHSPTLINFLTFFQGLRPYSRLHRAYLNVFLWWNRYFGFFKNNLIKIISFSFQWFSLSTIQWIQHFCGLLKI